MFQFIFAIKKKEIFHLCDRAAVVHEGSGHLALVFHLGKMYSLWVFGLWYSLLFMITEMLKTESVSSKSYLSTFNLANVELLWKRKNEIWIYWKNNKIKRGIKILLQTNLLQGLAVPVLLLLLLSLSEEPRLVVSVWTSNIAIVRSQWWSWLCFIFGLLSSPLHLQGTLVTFQQGTLQHQGGKLWRIWCQS